MSRVYNCACCKQSPADNRRNVFDGKPVISLQDKEEAGGHATLRDAVESITGYRIPEMDNAFLCETCFRKVESCVNFRCQLVASFARLNDAQMPDLDLPGLENASITGASLISKASDTDSDAFKEITNANESKVAYDLDRRSCSEADNDSSCADMPLNFHRGDVDSASNCGSDIGDDLSADPDDVAFYSKIQKSDIESEVNVCSGEDDQVLELSVNYEHNEISNVSSAESEEECDYGPTFKKIKLSNQISSPPILS